MRKGFVRYGLAAGMLIGLGMSGAEAAATRPMSPEALGLGPASTPAAMCGFRCAYGCRYIPGPPGVCYARGLNYCGPSGGWGGPPPWQAGGSMAEVPTAPGRMAGPTGVVLTGGLTAGKDMILGSQRTLTINWLNRV